MQNSLDGSGKLWVGGAERSEVQQPPTLAADSKTGVDQSSVAALQKNQTVLLLCCCPIQSIVDGLSQIGFG